MAKRPSTIRSSQKGSPRTNIRLSRPDTSTWFWYFKNRAKWSISMALFYAISDEFHQTLIQGRSGQMSDVLLDSISATLAICIFLKIFSSLKYFHKKSIHQNSFTS